MLVKASLVFPGLADHHDVGSGGAAEGVVCDASLMSEGFGGQGLGGLHSLRHSVLFFSRSEETIDSDHVMLVLKLLNETGQAGHAGLVGVELDGAGGRRYKYCLTLPYLKAMDGAVALIVHQLTLPRHAHHHYE